MDIGSGIAAAAGIFSVVMLIYKFTKAPDFNQALCDQKHRDLIVRLEKSDKEHDGVIDFLRRIEEKIDNHIDLHLKIIK